MYISVHHFFPCIFHVVCASFSALATRKLADAKAVLSGIWALVKYGFKGQGPPNLRDSRGGGVTNKVGSTRGLCDIELWVWNGSGYRPSRHLSKDICCWCHPDLIVTNK